jgi:hypothetical protein
MKRKRQAMANKYAHISLFLFLLGFAILPMNCKTQSTTPDGPPLSAPENSLLITCSPYSGGTGTVVDIKISTIGNAKEIKSFGLEMTFDPAVFQYQSTQKSDLTATWASVDGNEASAGKLRVGGFMGSGTPVQAGTNGGLAIIKIKVIYNGNDDGFSRDISIKNYLDDINGMKPDPSSTTFTYHK